MKKLITTLLILAIPVLSFASSNLQLGVRFNPNLSWVQTGFVDQPEDKDAEYDGVRFGFSTGLMSEYSFADNYALRTNLFFSRIGGRMRISVEQPDTAFTKDYNFKLDYIEIPIGLTLKTNEIGYMTYFAELGIVPGFAFTRSADVKVRSGGSRVDNQEDVNFKDNLNVFRFGVDIGAGVRYSLGGSTAIYASILYNYGFTNMIKKRPDDTILEDLRDINELKVSNNYISLNLGILF